MGNKIKDQRSKIKIIKKTLRRFLTLNFSSRGVLPRRIRLGRRSALGGELSTFNSEAGQALLIVILVMVIALTIGLAVLSRSITTIRTSTDEASSQKAFSAAEAGIEQAIKLRPTPDVYIGGSVGSDTGAAKFTYKVNTREYYGNEFILNGGNPVQKDEGIDVWMVDHNDDGTMNLNSGLRSLGNSTVGEIRFVWGESSVDCERAAMEIITISKGQPADPVKSVRHAFDPCTARKLTNNFLDTAGGRTIEGTTFNSGAVGGLDNTAILVRLIPLYTDAIIGVTIRTFTVGPTMSLPLQGRKIESTGISGQAHRKIVYYEGFRKLPAEFFQYVQFSK